MTEITNRDAASARSWCAHNKGRRVVARLDLTDDQVFLRLMRRRGRKLCQVTSREHQMRLFRIFATEPRSFVALLAVDPELTEIVQALAGLGLAMAQHDARKAGGR